MPLHVYTCLRFHVGKFFTIKMSSKKNKNKSKKASEGESSLILKEGPNDSSNLQTSSHEGGSCKSLNSDSFTVIDFIEKGKNLLHKPQSLTGSDAGISCTSCEHVQQMNLIWGGRYGCHGSWRWCCCSCVTPPALSVGNDIFLIVLSSVQKHIRFKMRHWLRWK